VLFIGLNAPEGASLEYTEQQLEQLEDILWPYKEAGIIRRMNLRIGGGFGGNQVNAVRGFMVLAPWQDREISNVELARELRGKIEGLPGARGFVFTPQGLARRGFSQGVQAVLGGPDYQTLAQWGDLLMEKARENPGLLAVDTDYRERKPQIRVQVDRDRAAELGVSLQTVGRTLETVLGSRIVTTYVDRGREYNVILQGEPADRASPSDLQNLYVRSSRSGDLVPLGNLVRLEETAGAIQLNRFDRLRAITISADLAPGYSMGEAVEWFQETVRAELPNARLSFDGEAREYLRSRGQLWTTFGFALAIVFLVLAAQFESFVSPLIIMLTVPLAALGALLALWATGNSINVYSQIGLVMLIGMAAKNAILIVEFAKMKSEEGMSALNAAIAAAKDRFRPILMTAFSFILGVIPLLIASGAGAEARKVMGMTVFAGMASATVIGVLLVPALFVFIEKLSGRGKPGAHTEKVA